MDKKWKWQCGLNGDKAVWIKEHVGVDKRVMSKEDLLAMNMQIIDKSV
jgi:hypothetical protein